MRELALGNEVVPCETLLRGQSYMSGCWRLDTLEFTLDTRWASL